MLHTEVMEPCASTSMTMCFQKYEEVLLLSMMDCFQCAVISMSKEYNKIRCFSVRLEFGLQGFEFNVRNATFVGVGG